MDSSRFVHSLFRLGGACGVFRPLISRVGRGISGPQATIVTFHDVFVRGDELTYGIRGDALEQSLEYFARCFNVVPLSHILDAIEGRRDLKPPVLAVTFDDGRKSFLTHALPALQKYRLCATVFVVTKTLEPPVVLWTDTVEQLVARLENVRLPRYLGYVPSLDASTGSLKRAAVIKLKAYLRYLPARRREVAIRELLRANGVSQEELPTASLYLTREDIPELLKSGVEIGSHSHSHEVFSLLSREEVRSELVTSKLILEKIAGKSVDCFAFPSGTRADFRPQDVSLAHEEGYRAVLTTMRGNVKLSEGQFLLPRVEAPGGYEDHPLVLFSGLLAVESLLCSRRERTLRSLAESVRRTNVLYVIDSLHPEYAGGTETQLESTIRHADKDFVNPSLCVLRKIVSGDFSYPAKLIGIKKLLSLDFVPALWRLARLMRRERIDIAHLFFLDSVVIGTIAARLAGVPVVITSRRGVKSLTGKKSALSLVKFLDRFATCVLSNSHAVRESVLEEENILPQKVMVIHNGMVVPPVTALAAGEAKAILELKPGEPSVGIVSNLRHVKGVDVFLRAAAVVLREEPLARFCIFGEGELREELEKLAKELRIAHAVKFLGFRKDAYALVPGLDVAVISSRSEGCSNALLEYCFTGSAIVATDVGGNAEIITDCENGLLVPADDAVLLGKGILKLLRDSHLRTWLGAQARGDVNEKFLLRDALRQLWCLYWRLLYPEDGSTRRGA